MILIFISLNTKMFILAFIIMLCAFTFYVVITIILLSGICCMRHLCLFLWGFVCLTSWLKFHTACLFGVQQLSSVYISFEIKEFKVSFSQAPIPCKMDSSALFYCILYSLLLITSHPLGSSCWLWRSRLVFLNYYPFTFHIFSLKNVSR